MNPRSFCNIMLYAIIYTQRPWGWGSLEQFLLLYSVFPRWELYGQVLLWAHFSTLDWLPSARTWGNKPVCCVTLRALPKTTCLGSHGLHVHTFRPHTPPSLSSPLLYSDCQWIGGSGGQLSETRTLEVKHLPCLCFPTCSRAWAWWERDLTRSLGGSNAILGLSQCWAANSQDPIMSVQGQTVCEKKLAEEKRIHFKNFLQLGLGRWPSG